MSDRDDFLKALVFAEAALDHLKAHELPASPRNFEFWYAYAAGFNRPLNRAVNELSKDPNRGVAARTLRQRRRQSYRILYRPQPLMDLTP